ncbi:AAA family ATPase [Nocardioides panacisoli]|uniref:AAA family ATPase n=1 Tax=Nocardioides panacisoli TaxID=627624 RepID=A0ABP7I4Y8_9ACTN
MSTDPAVEAYLRGDPNIGPGDVFPDLDDYDLADVDLDQASPELLARVALRRHRLLDRDALDHMPPPEPLIEGVLGRRGLAMKAGSRGLGKTLTALDWAGHVATGLPSWYGHQVAVHGPVLFIALEGFHGIPERVRAWEIHHGRRMTNVHWWPDPIDLRLRRDAKMIGSVARHLGAVLLIGDSVRATGAGKEDTADMGAYVTGLETIRTIYDGLTLVLHNSGWDGTRERGSTLLPDACDTTLLLQGDPEGIRTLKLKWPRLPGRSGCGGCDHAAVSVWGPAGPVRACWVS